MSRPSVAELVDRARQSGRRVGEVVLADEVEESGEDPSTLVQRMSEMLDVMRQSVAEGLSRGLRSRSGLVGGDAARVEALRTRGQGIDPAGLLSAAISRALAVSEVNAAMGRIVAAPTAGAAGVVPGVILALEEIGHASRERLVEALFTAAGVGKVIASRASLSGAEGGCQAETGSAAAMAAAAAVEVLDGSPEAVGQAVEFTLQNMMGLVCDPIAGLVEIPCLGRNAAAAGQALVAAELALSGALHPIPVDEVIDTMGAIGRQLPVSLRETGWGGLAVTPTGRSIAERLGLWTEPPPGADEPGDSGA